MEKIKVGVPQGSILGPLLFLMYINDIIHSSRMLHFTLFADDTSITVSDSDLNNLQNTINNEIVMVSDWLRANKLNLNLSKTNFMLFSGRKKIDFALRLNIHNHEIDRVSCFKYLGVFIDDKLN